MNSGRWSMSTGRASWLAARTLRTSCSQCAMISSRCSRRKSARRRGSSLATMSPMTTNLGRHSDPCLQRTDGGLLQHGERAGVIGEEIARLRARSTLDPVARPLEYVALDEALEPQPGDLLGFLRREQLAFEPRQLPCAKKIFVQCRARVPLRIELAPQRERDARLFQAGAQLADALEQ